MSYRTLVIEDDRTYVAAETDGAAKALAKNLIRKGKAFRAAPYVPGPGWEFVVYEENESGGLYA